MKTKTVNLSEQDHDIVWAIKNKTGLPVKRVVHDGVQAMAKEHLTEDELATVLQVVNP